MENLYNTYIIGLFKDFCQVNFGHKYVSACILCVCIYIYINIYVRKKGIKSYIKKKT